MNGEETWEIYGHWQLHDDRNTSTCIKFKYQQQLQSIAEMHGAETLLFGVFAANTNTHRCRLTTADTCITPCCVSLTQQTSHSYLFCLPVCLPTVFCLLLLCLGFMWCELLLATSDSCSWEDNKWGWKARDKWQMMYTVRWDHGWTPLCRGNWLFKGRYKSKRDVVTFVQWFQTCFASIHSRWISSVVFSHVLCR